MTSVDTVIDCVADWIACARTPEDRAERYLRWGESLFTRDRRDFAEFLDVILVESALAGRRFPPMPHEVHEILHADGDRRDSETRLAQADLRSRIIVGVTAAIASQGVTLNPPRRWQQRLWSYRFDPTSRSAVGAAFHPGGAPDDVAEA